MSAFLKNWPAKKVLGGRCLSVLIHTGKGGRGVDEKIFSYLLKNWHIFRFFQNTFSTPPIAAVKTLATREYSNVSDLDIYRTCTVLLRIVLKFPFHSAFPERGPRYLDNVDHSSTIPSKFPFVWEPLYKVKRSLQLLIIWVCFSSLTWAIFTIFSCGSVHNGHLHRDCCWGKYLHYNKYMVYRDTVLVTKFSSEVTDSENVCK
jgi:hypothetical protein